MSNTIYAFGGNDYLQGGTGSPSDVLVATGAGNDTFYGGTGNNYIVGGTGKNTIVGGGGALQTLYGNGSNGDYIVGGSSATASNVLVENRHGRSEPLGRAPATTTRSAALAMISWSAATIPTTCLAGPATTPSMAATARTTSIPAPATTSSGLTISARNRPTTSMRASARASIPSPTSRRATAPITTCWC